MSVFNKKTALALMSSTALTAVVASTPATAQDGPVIEEILVTATRRSASVLDIPYNISAVSGAEIEASNVLDSGELLRSIPGIAVSDRGPRNGGAVNGISIRGLKVDGSALGDYALTAVPTVSTYINDTPIFANLALKDLSRVEVLRGPQGTLYGSGSLGGTLRYIMNKPELETFGGSFGAQVSQTDGSAGYNQTSDVVLNVPLGSKAALRLVGSRLDNDGFVDYTNVYILDSDGDPVAPSGYLSDDADYRSVEDANTYESTYFRASLLWEPSERTSFTLSYTEQSDNTGGRRGVTRGLNGWGEKYGEYENGSIQLEPSEADISATSLEATFDLGFATLTSSTSTYNHEGNSQSENTGYYAQLDWLSTWYYTYPRPMASAYRGYEDKAFVQEIRLVSNATDADLDYVFGVYYMDQDTLATQESYLEGFYKYNQAVPRPWILHDQDWDYSRDVNFKEMAVYGEVTANVNDDVRLTGGLRYFKHETSSDLFMNLSLWDIISEGHNEDDASKIIGKINASWDYNDNTMFYATFSQGYRRGGANASPIAGPFAEDPAWLFFDADTVNNYEAGVKGTYGNGQRYVFSIFKEQWDDPQVNTTTPNGGFFAVLNGDKAETYGFEIELNGNLSDSLHYDLGYAFVKSELTADLVSHSGSVLAESGRVLPGTPENMFNIGLDYRHGVSDRVEFVGRLNGYYQSSTENEINPNSLYAASMPSFSIWNVSGTFIVDETTEISLFAKNLTNEEGVTGVFPEAAMGTDPIDNKYFGNGSKEQISLPRTIGLSVKHRF